jgi:hypothetical protein
VGFRLILQVHRHDRIVHTHTGIVRHERLNGLVGNDSPTADSTGGQQHGTAVEIESPRRPRFESDGSQHPDQRTRRVVREMPVAQRVPLSETDDRVQRVVLQQEDALGGHPGCPLRQGDRLIRVVHHAEGIDDQVSRPLIGHGRDAALAQEAQPRAPVRARKLERTVPSGEPPGGRQTINGVGSLGDERFWLHAAGLGRHRGSADQLGEAAGRAEPHLQRVAGIRARIVALGELVARRLDSQVEHDAARRRRARAARSRDGLPAAEGRGDPSPRQQMRSRAPHHRAEHLLPTLIPVRAVGAAPTAAAYHGLVMEALLRVRTQSDRGTMPSPCVCRLCGSSLTHTFVDLGMSPLCESYVPAEALDQPEVFYPLHVRQCSSCLLVQLPAYVAGEDIFSDYAYFSSYSDSWVAHAKRFADSMIERLGLTPDALVTEVASNDGYLLQHFLARGIPVLGVEPAKNVAETARSLGIPTVVQFLGAMTGADIAERHGRADLVVANNVFAHVPDIRDFAAGLRALVKDTGLVTLEFPHLLRLMHRRQFDTIYHEHYSYLSLLTASRALATAALRVVDVEELDTHGGSLRVFAQPQELPHEPSDRVKQVLDQEARAGLHSVDGHAGFAREVLKIKSDLVGFLVEAARAGRTVAGYGAPGKGNTLLNHCGIREDLLRYTVDRSPVKQGKFLPGTHIPIYTPDRLAETRPDYILVLPWNLRAEITEQLAYVRSWGARLVFPIPELDVV